MGDAGRALLFGGAIFAAGITPAGADDPLPFISNAYTGNTSAVYAATYLWPSGGGDDFDSSSDVLDPTSMAGVAAYIPGIASATAYGSVDLTSVNASTWTDNASFGMQVLVAAYVEFTEPTEVRFEWDFPDFGLCSITPAGTIDALGGAGAVFASSGVLVETHGPGVFALRCYSFSTSADAPAMARITLPSAPGCPCDLDGNAALNVDDVDAFVTAFLGGDLAADFDGNGSLNVDDVDAFVACFLAGCL